MFTYVLITILVLLGPLALSFDKKLHSIHTGNLYLSL